MAADACFDHRHARAFTQMAQESNPFEGEFIFLFAGIGKAESAANNLRFRHPVFREYLDPLEWCELEREVAGNQPRDPHRGKKFSRIMDPFFLALEAWKQAHQACPQPIGGLHAA